VTATFFVGFSKKRNLAVVNFGVVKLSVYM